MSVTEIMERARESGISPWLAIKTVCAERFLDALAHDPGPAVLQGGAALRFAYGSPRMSVDVDFAGVGAGGHICAHGPALAAAVQEAMGTPVAWSDVLVGRLTRAKLTLVLPSRTTLVLPVEAYDVAAHRPIATAVGPVESPEEIVADKVIATAERLERRGTAKLTDFYDIWFLRARCGADLPTRDLLEDKLRDYGRGVSTVDITAYVEALAPEDLLHVLERVLPPSELATTDVTEILELTTNVLETYRGLV
ncbi:MAG: hypothetical protein AMXMBFR64_27260 [Myxococcales bacterium]